MAKFCVIVVTTIQVSTEVRVSAKTEEDAQEKVNTMIEEDKFTLTWTPPEKTKFEFQEVEQTTEIDSCDKE